VASQPLAQPATPLSSIKTVPGAAKAVPATPIGSISTAPGAGGGAGTIQVSAGPPAGAPAPRHCSRHDETGKRTKSTVIRNVQCRACKLTFGTAYAEVVYCVSCSDKYQACMNCGVQAPLPGKARCGVSCTDAQPPQQAQAAVRVVPVRRA